MATPRKDISRYETALFSLFRRVKLQGTVSISLSSRHVAILMRNRLYAFRAAMLLRPNHSPDLTPVVSMTKMKVKANTLTLELCDDRNAARRPRFSRSRRLNNAGQLR